MEDAKDDLTQPAHSASDAAPGLFTPDILLASQHTASGPPDSPCRRLVGAVLERALLDAAGPTSRDPEREDALAWFRSDDEAPFSFRWIAHQLGIEPDWVRSRLAARQPPADRTAPEVPGASNSRRAA